MKLDRLQPFAPPVVEKPACAACKSFAPECLVPVGDGALAMCWLCAHHVVDHNTAVEHAHAGECECSPEEIYPERVLASRPLRFEHGDVDYTKPMKPGDWTRQSELSAAVAEQHKKILESMTPKQREIVLESFRRGSIAAVAERAAGYKSTKGK